MSYDLPESWADLFDRFARLLGGAGGRPEGLFYAEAEEWFRQAVEARHGAPTLRTLSRQERQLAFQRSTATLWALYDAAGAAGDLAFTVGVRDVIRACFAQSWQGIALEGPAWRLDPTETGRPAYADWFESDGF